MLLTLNEYTLALLCGGVSCLTYILIHLNDISENKLTKKNNKRCSSPASTSDSTEDLVLLRRPSQVAARYRAKRAESIKNDHIIFADEIKEDDEKFTPNPGIHDSEVEGILQNSEGGIDVQSIEDFEAPSLNTFDKSQPLDDLLIRRRSLHSSPANSRSGSRSGSVRISAPGDDGVDGTGSEEEYNAEDAQDLQVKTLQAEIALMQQDLSSLKAKDEKLEEERRHLECLLSIAIKQLHPEKSLPDTLQNSSLSENALEDYLRQFSS